jgi:hypothetical protein
MEVAHLDGGAGIVFVGVFEAVVAGRDALLGGDQVGGTLLVELFTEAFNGPGVVLGERVGSEAFGC